MSGYTMVPNANRPARKLADSARGPAAGTKSRTTEPAAATERTGTEPGAAQLMRGSLRLGIGVYLIVLGVALLAAILWSWSFASSLISANSGITVALYLFGVKFFPSAGFSLLLIVLLTTMLGSVAVLRITFSSRAGTGFSRVATCGGSQRPISAVALGLLVYMAVTAGSSTQPRPKISQRSLLRRQLGTGRSLRRPGPKEDAEYSRSSPDRPDSIRQGRRWRIKMSCHAGAKTLSWPLTCNVIPL